MNYLAHTFLSFSDSQIVGNLLEDFVKNSERLDYPPEIKKGIILHRAIDTFTDTHPVIHEAKKIFQPKVRLYSGAFVDVAMDYFLANDSGINTEKDWMAFTEKVYNVLNENEIWLPTRLKKILPKMQQDNWLLNYRYDLGIKYSLNNIVQKAKYLDPNTDVFHLFIENKSLLESHYNAFFPELLEYAQTINEELKLK